MWVRRNIWQGSIVAVSLAALVSTALSLPAQAEAVVANHSAPLAIDPPGERMLIPGLSTETTNTYLMPDGSTGVESFLEPVNYQDDTGRWVPIDNTLVPAPGAAYEAENDEAGYLAKIPADAGSTPVKLTSDGFSITMKMRGLDGVPVIDEDTATFDQVANADSVELKMTGGGVKESITLNQPPAGLDPVVYTYDLTVSSGITPRLVPSVGVQFVDAQGEVKATVPVGSMWDAAQPSASRDTGDYLLTGAGSGWVLQMTPDATWLRDPSRVYPVVIDPSLDFFAQKDCVIKSANPGESWCWDQNQRLSVGRDDASKRFRSLLDFATNIPAGSTVTSATLELHTMHPDTVGSTSYAAYTPSKPWDSQASWNSAGAAGAWTGGSGGSPNSPAVNVGPSSNQVTLNVTSIVQAWVNGSYKGILLAPTSETNAKAVFWPSALAMQGNKPHLWVSYNPPPEYSAPVVTSTVYSCPTTMGGHDGQVAVYVTNPNNVAAPLWVSLNGQDPTWSSVPAQGTVGWMFTGFEAGTTHGGAYLYSPVDKGTSFAITMPQHCNPPGVSTSADRCVEDGESNATITATVTNPNGADTAASVTINGQTQTVAINANGSKSVDFPGFGAGTYSGTATLGAPISRSTNFTATVPTCPTSPPPAGPGLGAAGDRPFWQFSETELTDRITAKANVGTGNLLIQAQDVSVAGIAGWDMAMTRYYNSALAGDGTGNMGKGWSTAFGGSVRLDVNSPGDPVSRQTAVQGADGSGGIVPPQNPTTSDVSFWGPSAYRTIFKKNLKTAGYTAVKPGIKAKLSKTSSGYLLTWHDKGKYTFDSQGQLQSTQDKNGNKLTFNYGGPTGKLSVVKDTRNRTANLAYNSDGLVRSVEIRKPDGTPMLRWEYTYAGSPLRLATSKLAFVDDSAAGGTYATPSSDPTVGAVTSYEYNANGYLSRITDARAYMTNQGGITDFDYDTQGRLKSVKRLTWADPAPDSTTSFNYFAATGDQSGTCKSVADKNAATRTTVNGERTDVQDVTKYCVDDVGRILRTTDANGHVRSKSWDDNSNIQSADMSGTGSGVENFTYHYTNDNQDKVTTPEGATSTASYTDPVNDHSVSEIRNDQSAISSSNSQPAASWDYDYDDKNNLIKATSGGGLGIKYFYCWTLDGQIKRIDPVTATGTAQNSTDPQRNTSNDATRCNGDPAQGNDTLFTYNAQGELTQVDRPNGGDQTFTYDNLSRLKTVKDGRDVTITYKYDGLDRVVQAIYSKAGQTTQTVTWGYDLAGNLVSLGDLNGTNTFTYDELNRKHTESAQGVVGSTTYDYDSASNLTKTTTTLGSTTYQTRYDYEPVNMVREMNVSADNAGNSAMTTQKITFGYDKKDNRVRTTFVGTGGDPDIVQAARYDKDGKAECFFSYKADNAPSNPDNCPDPSFAGLITYYGYDYDRFGVDTGLKWSMTELGGKKTDYDYDAISRLKNAQTRAAGGAVLRTFDYGYDRHSNVTKEAVSGTTPGLRVGTQWTAFNPGDEICASFRAGADPSLDCSSNLIGQTNFQHDNAGNLTTAAGGAAVDLDGLGLDYNLPGQTTSIDPPGAATAQPQAYDGVMQDRRTSSGNTSMAYGFSGLAVQATAGTGAHGEMFVRDPGGGLLAMIDTSNTAAPSMAGYYLTDDQQSVMAVIKPNGSSATRYLYEPYGEQIRSWADPAPGTANSVGTELPGGSPSIDGNPWRYASGYYEKDAGLLKFGTRYYIPGVATWTQADSRHGSVDDPVSVNLYSYAAANPSNHTDRTGRYPGEDVVDAVAGWDGWDETACIGATVGIVGLWVYDTATFIGGIITGLGMTPIGIAKFFLTTLIVGLTTLLLLDVREDTC